MRKLKRRVEELEAEVEQLKKRTENSKAVQIITWTVAIVDLATAILALIAVLAGWFQFVGGGVIPPSCLIRISQEGVGVNENR